SSGTHERAASAMAATAAGCISGPPTRVDVPAALMTGVRPRSAYTPMGSSLRWRVRVGFQVQGRDARHGGVVFYGRAWMARLCGRDLAGPIGGSGGSRACG